MWLFTDTGFISAVRKPEYPNVFTVRARDRESLESLAEKAQVEIKRSPHGDYPYRVFVSVESFNQWLVERSGELTYSNFKNRVSTTRSRKFVSALHNVWEAMLAVEDDEARSSLTDSDGNPISHSDAKPRSNPKKELTKLPGDFNEMSKDERQAWAERVYENLRRTLLPDDGENGGAK